MRCNTSLDDLNCNGNNLIIHHSQSFAKDLAASDNYSYYYNFLRGESTRNGIMVNGKNFDGLNSNDSVGESMRDRKTNTLRCYVNGDETEEGFGIEWLCTALVWMLSVFFLYQNQNLRIFSTRTRNKFPDYYSKMNAVLNHDEVQALLLTSLILHLFRSCSHHCSYSQLKLVDFVPWKDKIS